MTGVQTCALPISSTQHAEENTSESSRDTFQSDESLFSNIISVLFSIAVIVFLVGFFTSGNTNTKVQTKAHKPVTYNPPPPLTKPNSTISKSKMTEIEYQELVGDQLNKLKSIKTPIFWVGDEHRTHPWSLRPGGCTVVVIFSNKECKGYDKVKRPDAYTTKITEDFVCNIRSNKQIKNLEDYLDEIYLVKEKEIILNKVWDKNMRISPWKILEKYRVE